MSFNIVESLTYRKELSRQRLRYLLVEHLTSTVHLWEQVALMLIFGLLLIMVVLACTGYISLFVVCGLIAGLGVAALTILWPQLSLLLVFLGAGLPSILIPVPGHTMRPLEVPLFLGFALIFVRRPTMRLRLPHILALLFLAIALVSFLHVPVIAQSLNDYGADKRLYAWVLILLALFEATFLARYIKNLSLFFFLILLANLPYLLIGAAQALHIHLSTLWIPSTAIEVTQEGRLSGSADSPTTFAFYLIDLLAVALVCWTLGKRRWQRCFGAIMLALIFWELLGSGTRSALGTGLVMTLVALLMTRRFKWLFGLALLVVPLTTVTFNTFLAKFIHGNASLSNRLFLWQQALKLITSHVWIGIGLEQFPSYYAKLIVGQAVELNPAGISVHNQYLELALESGVFWLVVGLLLLFSLARFCWKTYKRATGEHRLALLVTFLLVLAMLIISVVDVPLDKVEGTVFFFLVAGIALGYARPLRQARAQHPTQPPIETHKTHMLAEVQGQSRNGTPLALHEVIQPDASLTLRLPRSWLRAANEMEKMHETYTIPLPGYIQTSALLPSQLTAPMPRIRTSDLSGELSSAPKTGKAVIIQIISWAIAIPLILPSTALMTRYFGPLRYGEYSFTLSILAVCALGSMTGMDSWLIRDLSRQKRAQWGESLGYAVGTRLLTSLLISGLAALIIWFLPLGNEQRGLLLLGVGTLTFSFSFNCLRAVYECGFVAEQQINMLALLTTLNRVTTAGLIVLAVLLRFSLLWSYVLIAYSDLPFFLILLLLARRRFRIRLHIDLARSWNILRESIPFTSYDALALFSSQIDILLLLPLAGSLSVGFYALALRITNPLLNIAFAYVGGLYPYLCTRFEKGHQEFANIYREATRVLALGIIPLTLFVVMEAPAIIELLAGDKYTAAIMPTRLLMISVALAFFSQLTLRTCMAANQENKIPLISGITLVITLLANALLIPLWQATGASVAAIVAELVSVCLFSALLAPHVNLWSVWGVLLRVMLGNLPGLVLLLWQPHLPLLVLAAGTGLLLFPGYVITRTLSLNDARIARQMVDTRLLRRRKA
jgi:O-antigen/teichoic acid export membrane protein/O-antigen ligase